MVLIQIIVCVFSHGPWSGIWSNGTFVCTIAPAYIAINGTMLMVPIPLKVPYLILTDLLIIHSYLLTTLVDSIRPGAPRKLRTIGNKKTNVSIPKEYTTTFHGDLPYCH